MRYRDVRPDDVPALVDLAMARCPHLMAWWVTGLFADGVDVDVARVVEADAGPVAFAAVTHRSAGPSTSAGSTCSSGERSSSRGAGQRCSRSAWRVRLR